ncbi:PAS domain S-box protein [Alkalihalobacillus sp. AL-G]|uniref:PAS domain S-box protein n=1 Tax=Alkalihalobacillus sp. AL-G TaxID=2926399 RepID=UPI00272AC7AB|nr:PAS domain S-box protein [Alkalihalobacillus sp. AL-G]WLD95485.1 PAS domain S-box protein [Alkalihalobacillus sp. AL-G]
MSAVSLEFDQSLLDCITDGFIQLDNDSRIVYANQAMMDLLETDYRELIGEKVTHFFPVIEFNSINNGEWQHSVALKPNQTGLDVSVCYYLRENGRIDVLSKIQCELNNPTFLADFAADKIAIHDLEGRYIYASPSIHKLYGYKVQGLIGKLDVDYVHPEDRTKILDNFEKLKKAGETPPIEYRMLHSNGEYRWSESTCKIIPFHTNGIAVLSITRDIHERKLNEQLIERTYQQYESLFYQNSVPIFSIDLEGTIIDVNPAVVAAIGYKKEELIGKSFEKHLLSSKDRAAIICLEEVKKGRRVSCEMLLKPKSGKDIEFHFRHIPIFIDGKLSGAYGVARNISDLKRTQEALQESEHRYRQLVENSPDPICLHDSNRIVYVNDVAIKMLGVKNKQDVIGKEISKFIHIQHQVESRERVQHVMGGLRFERLFPMKIVRPDGDILEMEGKSIPIKHKGKTYVLAVFRDETEKNRAKRSLQQSERRYRSLFQHNPDGIYSINLKGELTSVNPAIEKITGYTKEEQIGKSYTDFLLPEERTEIVTNYKQIFKGKPIEFEKRMLRKDGVIINVRVIGFPMIVDNIIIGMYGILRDISDEKRSEEMLRRSEKLTVVGELAAAVAHEIRNPLTSIKGFIQMMRLGLGAKEQYYQIILSEMDRIELIISELLVLAKPQSISYEKKPIGSMIRHVLKLLEGQANMNNIRFVTDLEAANEEIECEENQIKQVFINLIKNAIEVMPDGGKIYISCKKTDTGQLLIRIRDQGPGIPKELLTRLGEPFYTTKEKGTGLGLMISFKIIKDHKGSIQFSSSEQDGTTVDILLP